MDDFNDDMRKDSTAMDVKAMYYCSECRKLFKAKKGIEISCSQCGKQLTDLGISDCDYAKLDASGKKRIKEKAYETMQETDTRDHNTPDWDIIDLTSVGNLYNEETTKLSTDSGSEDETIQSEFKTIKYGDKSMVQQYKEGWKKETILIALFSLMVASAILGYFFKDYIPIGAEQDLDMITPDQIHEGRARITVYYIWDYYAAATNTFGREIQRSYFVMMGPDGANYVGVELEDKKNDKAYKLLNDIYEAENTEGVPDYSKLDSFTVHGHIKKITDYYKFYDDYLEMCAQEYGVNKEELKKTFIPYVLVQNKVSSGSEIFPVFAIFLFCIGIYGLYKAFFGNPYKEVEAYAKEIGSDELAESQLEHLLETVPGKYGIRADDRFFLYTGHIDFRFAKSEDVLWIYPYTVTQRINFVPFKTNYVMIRLKNGKYAQVSASHNAADDIIDYCKSVLPDAIYGYSKEIENIYRSNRGHMADIVLRNRNERLMRG